MNQIFIDIKDAVRRIVLGWRLIIICMLIGAIVFNAIGYVKSVKNAENASIEVDPEDEIQSLENAYLAAQSALTQREVNEVDMAVDAYFVYLKKYQDIREYSEESVKMQLDPTSVPTITLQYLIDTHYQAVYPVIEKTDITEDVKTSYKAAITTEEVLNNIIAELKWETKSAYIKELISSSDQTGNVLTISINAPDKESCQIIASVIEDAVNTSTAEIKSIYGEFDITKILEEYGEVADKTIQSAQLTQTTNMNTLRSALNALQTNMTTEQKTYYQAFINLELVRMEMDGEEVTEEISDREIQDIEPVAVKKIHLKYIILGMFGGAFLAVCYIGAMYLLSVKLRTKEDLEESYGISVIGTINAAEQKKRILGCVDQLIEKVFSSRELQFSEEEKFDMICAGIRLRAAKSGMKSVHLTGVVNDKETEKLMAAITEKLKNSLEITYGKPVIYDPEALEAMTNADGLIFLGRIAHSRYDDTKKLLTVCKDQKVPILGGVVITQIYR